MTRIPKSYYSNKRSMNGANLSTYVYQGKKKSTQFPQATHKGYTSDPQEGYKIENQHHTAHNRYTEKRLNLYPLDTLTQKELIRSVFLDLYRGKMLGQA